jgi:hypothetical protein
VNVALDFRVTAEEADRVHVGAIRERKPVTAFLRDMLREVFAHTSCELDVAPAVPWHASGLYFETCSCDFVCPCATSGMTAEPTDGTCTFAMAFQVARGQFGTVPLDGLGFIIVGLAPGAMNDGDWSVGVITDARADAGQRDALAAIGSGRAGGPLGQMSGLFGQFLGATSAPMHFGRDEASWSIHAPGHVEMVAEVTRQDLEVEGHPVADRLQLARAQRATLRAWHLTLDAAGGTHGQHAPFSWRRA